MIITNSPDINNLLVQVTFDISGNLPQVSLVNLSTGSNLGNVSYAFGVISPSGTFIHNGVITSPDVVGVWTTHTLNDPFPRPMNQIEWSGAPYQFYVIAKDSVGNIYQTSPQLASICRPSGNNQYSKTTFGLGKSTVDVKCQDGRVFFQDQTNNSYKGLSGTLINSTLQVDYPRDTTGSIPSPFQITNYSTALVPITYGSDNYQFLQNSVYDYDFGNNTLVRIKYQLIKTFAVWCNVDLQPLQCEINKLIDTVENGNCSDVVEARNKMLLIVSKFTLVMAGITQPLLGINVPKLVKEIIEIGGFDCDCCGSPTGIIPTQSSLIDGYSFSIVSVGGDIGGTVVPSGTNIQFLLHDVSYIVNVNQTSPSTVSAFSFTPSISGGGFNKTYTLNIDGHQLALDVLENIGSNVDALNLFNSLVTGNTLELTVDGACIFENNLLYDYDFTLHNIPASTTFALLTNIQYPKPRVLNFAFNLTNLTGANSLQSYLNSLNIGTFTVTNLGGGNVLIQSNSNIHNINSLTYKIIRNTYNADISVTTEGYVPITANEIVQNIIYYLCGLTDAQLVTSQEYVINYIDSNGVQQSTTVNSGVELTTFLTQLLEDGNSTVQYISTLNQLNCANIKAQFPQSTKLVQPNDIILGTKAGSCAEIHPVELGIRILQLGVYDQDFLNALCNATALCSAGKICDPYSTFTVNPVFHSPSDNELDLVVTFVNSNPSVLGSVIRYARIDNTSTPLWLSVGQVTAGSSPYTIPNLPQGQYIVGVTPYYSDGRVCSELTLTTLPCTGINAFSAAVVEGQIVVTYSASSPYVNWSISYPNGGLITGQVANGASISESLPSGIYGNYTVTLQPVCNRTTNWVGQSTAPVILNVATPTGTVTAQSDGNFTPNIVTSITGISGFSLSGNLNVGGVQSGIHYAFTNQTISVTITGAATAGAICDVTINGILVGTINVASGAGTYTLTNISANATDPILLEFHSNL